MDILHAVLEILGMLAGFGAFIWLAFIMLLIKVIRESQVIEDQQGEKRFVQSTLQAWPKVMKLMYLSGIAICALICAPFISSPTFTGTNILIIIGCMVIGFFYLRHFTIKAQIDFDRKSLRHCIWALFVSSGYLAAVIIVGIINPIFGGQSLFVFS